MHGDDDLGRVSHAAAWPGRDGWALYGPWYQDAASRGAMAVADAVRAALDAANGATEAAPPTGQQVLPQSPEDTTPDPGPPRCRRSS